MFDDLGKGVFSMNLAKYAPAAAGDISAQLSVVLIRLCCVFRVTGHSSWRRGQLGTKGGNAWEPKVGVPMPKGCSAWGQGVPSPWAETHISPSLSFF